MFPFVDVTVFCHILPFSRITSIFMFKEFSKNKKLINFYEYLCAMLLTSYSNMSNKIHCII